MGDSFSGAWPGLETPEATTGAGAPSFAYFAKGGYTTAYTTGSVERAKVAPAASPPTPSASSGQALAKNARMGHPRDRKPGTDGTFPSVSTNGHMRILR